MQEASVKTQEACPDIRDVLSDAYRLAGDLLAYPEDVDTAEIEGRVEAVARALGERVGGQTAGLLRSFFEDWKAITPGEYIDTLELSPRCPLYLGYWAFLNEGPDSPPRRRFMGRLIDIYRRFDLSLGGKELPVQHYKLIFPPGTARAVETWQPRAPAGHPIR